MKPAADVAWPHTRTIGCGVLPDGNVLVLNPKTQQWVVGRYSIHLGIGGGFGEVITKGKATTLRWMDGAHLWVPLPPLPKDGDA